MLDPEKWSKVDELFDAALDQPPEERSRWLEEACTGDEDLRTRVKKLLALGRREDDGLRPSGAMTGPVWEEVVEELDVSDDADLLKTADRIGPYEIVGLLGKGGMGRVYRAQHPSLGRQVAVKVLSEDFAGDRSALRRFRREAKLLASLNHPNIAAVYDLLWVGEKPFLILELVEGETLQERLSRGHLEYDQTLSILSQLLAALEEAHGKGVVHRDLKPANIKLSRDGRVKVLDFGLAKLHLPETSESSRLETSILTTQSGMVLGTPGYMSPEQARGQMADKRADIWAVGCILYEMLTGVPPFGGETPSDAIASILRDEVDWSRVSGDTPPELGRFLRQCLQKDPEERLQDIGAARRELGHLTGTAWEDALFRSGAGLLRPTRPWSSGTVWLWSISSVLLLLLVVAVVFVFRSTDEAVPRLTNAVQLTSEVGREDFPAWSPDGRTLAYAAMFEGNWDVWVTQVQGGQPLNRTPDFYGTDFSPSWSPDGKQIVFRSARDGGGIYAMSPLSGSSQKLIAREDAVFLLATPQWSPDGSELFYTVVGDEPRTAQVLDVLSLKTGEIQRFNLPGRWGCRCEISLSPDGRLLAYVDAQGSAAQVSQIWLYRWADREAIQITDGRTSDWSPTWSPDGRFLFYVSNRGGSFDLWQQRIDGAGVPSGPPREVTAGVGMQRAVFSPDGRKLAYSKGRRVGNLFRVPILTDRRATWADAEQITFDEALVEFVDVSPDGKRLVVSSDRGGNPDLWIMPADGGDMEQITSDPTPDWLPDWSPDGRNIAFYAYRSGNRDLWVMPAGGGPARQLTRDPGSDVAPAWSPDGKTLAFYTNRSGHADVWLVSVDDGRAEPLVSAPSQDRFPKYSPDGNWVAYSSWSAGGSAVWRIPAEGGDAERLTESSANYLVWSPGGAAIYYNLNRGEADGIWTVSADGGDERAVTDFDARRGRLGREALATDGRWLYFTWEEDLGDIWVMDVESGT